MSLPSLLLLLFALGVSATWAVSSTEPFGFHPASVAHPDYTAGTFTDAESIGVAWHRPGLYAFWNRVQRSLSSDELDFTQLDAQYREVPEGLTVLGNIVSCHLPQESQGYCDVHSYTPLDPQAYDAFVRQTVERYDGDGVDDMPDLKSPIHTWQMGNEPEAISLGFAELQQRTYTAIKSACSSCTVLMGGATGVPSGYIQKFEDSYHGYLSTLAGASLDVMDFHWYGDAHGDYRLLDSQTGESVYTHIRTVLESVGFRADLPVWITEMGTYSGTPDMWSEQTEQEQAADLFKRFLYPLALGVKKVFSAWGMIEGFKGENGYFDHTGLIYDGEGPDDLGLGVKKLAYYTYKKMTEKLSGSDWSSIQFVRASVGEDHFYQVKVSRGVDTVHVAWWDWFEEESEDQKSFSVSGLYGVSAEVTEVVPDASSGKDVTDYATAFRVSHVSVTEEGVATITLGINPIIIECKSSANLPRDSDDGDRGLAIALAVSAFILGIALVSLAVYRRVRRRSLPASASPPPSSYTSMDDV